MAFRASYDKNVAAARVQSKPVKWWISAGDDKQARRAPIEQAVIDGLISPSVANNVLIDPISSNVLELIKEKIPQLAAVGGGK